MHVFVAAPFTGHFDSSSGLTNHGLAAFLNETADELEASGCSAFLAHRREKFGDDLWPPLLCTPFDRLEMQHADCVVAYPGASYGVHVELGWASALQKRVLVIIEEPGIAQSPLVDGLRTIAPSEVFVAPSGFLHDAGKRRQVIAAIRRWVDEVRSEHAPRSRYGIFVREFVDGHRSAAGRLSRTLRERRPAAELHLFTSDRAAVARGEFDCIFDVDVDATKVVGAVEAIAGRYDALFSLGESLLVRSWRRGAEEGTDAGGAWLRLSDTRLIHAPLADAGNLIAHLLE